MIDPRYPIGSFEMPAAISAPVREEAIAALAAAPAQLRAAVSGLTDAQLDTRYRDHGWTARQVVHHLADSHVNAYVRLRLALTETEPTIRPYDEARWAELVDARSGPLAPSLALLDALHERWVSLWRSLRTEDFSRMIVHPEHGTRNVDWLLFLYAWHGRHHTAHITSLRSREGW